MRKTLGLNVGVPQRHAGPGVHCECVIKKVVFCVGAVGARVR